MSKGYVVTAAYVTLRVPDATSREVLQGFHQGAGVPEGVNSDDLDRHVRKGMVAEQGSQEADLRGVPAGTPTPGPAVEAGRRPRRAVQRSGDEAKD